MFKIQEGILNIDIDSQASGSPPESLRLSTQLGNSAKSLLCEDGSVTYQKNQMIKRVESYKSDYR